MTDCLIRSRDGDAVGACALTPPWWPGMGYEAAFIYCPWLA
jgi:hypothetical protein